MKLSLNHTHSSSRRTQESFGHRIANDPYLDWLILVIVSLVLAGIMIGFGFTTYNNVQYRINAPAVSTPVNAKAFFDVNALGKILDSFKFRAEEQERLKKGYVGVADPSV